VHQNVIITRRQLWHRVWAQPIYKVAHACGISRRVLIRRCKENNVPLPAPGFWATLSADRSAKRIPLPPGLDGAPIHIELYAFSRSRSLDPKMDPVSGRKMRIPIPAVKGPPKHPLTIRTLKLLAGARTDDAGILISDKARLNHLMVSPATLPRALRFLDALFLLLDQPPFVVTWPESNDGRLEILVRGERFIFVLVELVAQTRPSRRGRKVRPGQTAEIRIEEYRLTGTLRLLLSDFPVARVRRLWTDREAFPLEGCLRDIVSTLLSATTILNLKRAEGKTWRQQWEERRRREDTEALEHEQPRRRMDVVRQFAWSWAEGAVLKDFLFQLSRSITRLKSSQERRRGRELVAWVRKQIAKEDATQNIKKLLEGFDRA